MPEKGERWCIHYRENDHSTSECIKCDYCERRGHAWEDCPTRLSVPAIRIAAPVGQESTEASGGQISNQPHKYYRSQYTNSYPRAPPRKLICWRCHKEGHYARDCTEVLAHQPNSNVNLVHPEVAAVIRAQLRELPMSPQNTQINPIERWQKLKQEAVQITKDLKKRKPQLSES